MPGIATIDWIPGGSAAIMGFTGSQVPELKEEHMKQNELRNAFTFAEIVVAAPWVAAILSTSQDNDKAVMLQSNKRMDEGSPDLLVLETAARQQRAAYLAAAIARLGAWVKSWRHRVPATQR